MERRPTSLDLPLPGPRAMAEDTAWELGGLGPDLALLFTVSVILS